MESTRLRAMSYTFEEKAALAQIIDEIAIVENRATDADTNMKKALAWAQVGKVYNAKFPRSPRNVTQLKKCWDKIKRQRKLRAAFGDKLEGLDERHSASEENSSHSNFMESIATDNSIMDASNTADDPLTSPNTTMNNAQTRYMNSAKHLDKRPVDRVMLARLDAIQEERRLADEFQKHRMKMLELEYQQKMEEHETRMEQMQELHDIKMKIHIAELELLQKKVKHNNE